MGTGMKVLVTAVTTLPSYTQPRRAGVRAATRKTLAWGLWKLRQEPSCILCRGEAGDTAEAVRWMIPKKDSGR